MLRWISSVPPRMEIEGLVRNSVCHSPSSTTPSGPRRSSASAAVALRPALPRSFAPEPSGPGVRPARAASASAASRQARYFELDDRRGEPLTRERVGTGAALTREVDQSVFQVGAPAAASDCAGAALVCQRGAGHAPAFAGRVDAILVGHHRPVEMHLAEMRVAVHLAQRPHGHTGGAHVEAERGDAGVLGHRRVGALRAATPAVRSAPDCSTPSSRLRASRRRRAPLASPATPGPSRRRARRTAGTRPRRRCVWAGATARTGRASHGRRGWAPRSRGRSRTGTGRARRSGPAPERRSQPGPASRRGRRTRAARTAPPNHRRPAPAGTTGPRRGSSLPAPSTVNAPSARRGVRRASSALRTPARNSSRSLTARPAVRAGGGRGRRGPARSARRKAAPRDRGRATRRVARPRRRDGGRGARRAARARRSACHRA